MSDNKPPRLLDDYVLLWWFLVVLVGAAFLSQSSTESWDTPGIVGVTLLIWGCWKIYQTGLSRNE